MLVDATATEVAQLHTMFSLGRDAVGAVLAPDEWVRIETDTIHRTAYASVNVGDAEVRRSRTEACSVDEGLAALVRALVVPRLHLDYAIDFKVSDHDLLRRLLRVFA